MCAPGTGRRSQRALSYFQEIKRFTIVTNTKLPHFLYTHAFVLARADGRDALAHVKKHVQREVAARCAAGQHGSFEKKRTLN
jgi:hypothetical protein